MDTDRTEEVKEPSKRRSFYVDDDIWYRFQSKLWSEKMNASRWIREMIEWYLEDPGDGKEQE